MKICIDCKRELYEYEFPVTPKGNLRTRCKPCFKKAKYILKKAYIEKIGGLPVKSNKIIDKFKVNKVPLLGREYWNFIK